GRGPHPADVLAGEAGGGDPVPDLGGVDPRLRVAAGGDVMAYSRRRYCRLCGRSTSIDEMIEPEPAWGIPHMQHPRRICLRCTELVHRIRQRRYVEELAEKHRKLAG